MPDRPKGTSGYQIITLLSCKTQKEKKNKEELQFVNLEAKTISRFSLEITEFCTINETHVITCKSVKPIPLIIFVKMSSNVLLFLVLSLLLLQLNVFICLRAAQLKWFDVVPL